MRIALVLLLLVLSPPAPAEESGAIPGHEPDRGRFVLVSLDGSRRVLTASPRVAATLVSPDAGTPTHPPDGLEIDPRGERLDLRARGAALYRVPPVEPPRGFDADPPLDAWQAALAGSPDAQPVFEHGAGLRIASDEIFLDMPGAEDAEGARTLLGEAWDVLGIVEMRRLRGETFVCRLDDPSHGRAFEVAIRLARLDAVSRAEPSFVNVFLETPGESPAVGVGYPNRPRLTHTQQIETPPAGGRFPQLGLREPDPPWVLFLDAPFEAPVEEWFVGREEGANRIVPIVTRKAGFASERSVYMTGKGLAGNKPPAPYDVGAGAVLLSPVFSGPPISDVFVELRFRADLETPAEPFGLARDFARVLVYDETSPSIAAGATIAPVAERGDLTATAGTPDGWRKLMFRLPLSSRQHLNQLLVQFVSDGGGGAGGVWIDEVRVLGRRGSRRPRALRHAEALRQHAIYPDGQIVGFPRGSDPVPDVVAAWSIRSDASDVVVAVLDDGVERRHPDLTLWRPTFLRPVGIEDPELLDAVLAERERQVAAWQAVFPGEPVDPLDRHGTACAGVAAAPGGNGGVVGVAPGARILPLLRGADDVSLVHAIDAAVDLGVDVLVVPWGWSGASPAIVTRALVDALDAGVAVVAAAGDGVHRPYERGVDFPCSLASTTSLVCAGAASVDGTPKGPAGEDGQYWWASAADRSGPSVLAPGTWLHATDRSGALGYNDGLRQDVGAGWTDSFSGTGAAACYTAGVASLVIAHAPETSPARLKEILTGTTRSGVIDPAAALRGVKSSQNVSAD